MNEVFRELQYRDHDRVYGKSAWHSCCASDRWAYGPSSASGSEAPARLASASRSAMTPAIFIST